MIDSVPGFPQPHPHVRPLRILFVLARTGTAESEAEAEVRLLAQLLDPTRFRVDVIPCFDTSGAPLQTCRRLETSGVDVDRTALSLSLEDTVLYLQRKVADYEVVVACEGVPDIHPALDGPRHRPPLVERVTRVTEAAGPKHLTTLVAVASPALQAATAALMPTRSQAVRLIPPMVELGGDPARRATLRASLGIAAGQVMVGWFGTGTEVVLTAAALVARDCPQVRFAIAGVPPPDLERRVKAAGLRGLLVAADLPLQALDIALCQGDIAQAGAAGLPVIAIADADHRNALSVPEGNPQALAAAIRRLADAPRLRRRLGRALQAQVAATCAPQTVARQWQALFDEAMAGTAAPPASLFRSYVQGGFECSTHRLRSGRRLDLLASTGHDRHAAADYRQLGRAGMRTFRDGLRWHLCEPAAGRYDFGSWRPMLRAARDTGAQVIWDLLHYGWPDNLDIWRPDFVTRFAAFARAAAQTLAEETDDVPFWCPVNEMSFMAWGGGDVGYLNPFARGRGHELKVQMARASIAAMQALRDVDPRARFVHCEPLIAIHDATGGGGPGTDAWGWHHAQFQAHEMIAGTAWPQLGGDPSFLDIVGVNYYFNNQWIHGGPPIDVDHPRYRPLSDLLVEVHGRFGRPLLIAETSIEGPRRASWFTYVATEADRARARGVPVEGICLYPVLSHLGWDDDRLCPNGLLGHEVLSAPVAGPTRELSPTGPGGRTVEPNLWQAVKAVAACHDATARVMPLQVRP